MPIKIDMDSTEYNKAKIKGSSGFNHLIKRGFDPDSIGLRDMRSDENADFYYGLKDGFCEAKAKHEYAKLHKACKILGVSFAMVKSYYGIR